MKRPIPAVIACFKFSGIASINFVRKDVNDNKIKIIPATNTAENAIAKVMLS